MKSSGKLAVLFLFAFLMVAWLVIDIRYGINAASTGMVLNDLCVMFMGILIGMIPIKVKQ